MEDLKEKFDSLPKNNRRNIIMMVLLVVMFLIGIIVRWEYISTELSGSVDRYVNLFDRDTTVTKE